LVRQLLHVPHPNALLTLFSLKNVQYPNELRCVRSA
jgi:hypothetical protein